MVWTWLPFIRSGPNHLARYSERGKKTRQTGKRGGKKTSGKGKAWSSSSPRGLCTTEKKGRNWLWSHLWCPNDHRGYGIGKGKWKVTESQRRGHQLLCVLGGTLLPGDNGDNGAHWKSVCVGEGCVCVCVWGGGGRGVKVKNIHFGQYRNTFPFTKLLHGKWKPSKLWLGRGWKHNRSFQMQTVLKKRRRELVAMHHFP